MSLHYVSYSVTVIFMILSAPEPGLNPDLETWFSQDTQNGFVPVKLKERCALAILAE